MFNNDNMIKFLGLNVRGLPVKLSCGDSAWFTNFTE